jgi:hypothetical protein
MVQYQEPFRIYDPSNILKHPVALVGCTHTHTHNDGLIWQKLLVVSSEGLFGK